MKLANPSILKLSVDPQKFLLSARDRKIAMHVLEQLLSGEEAAVEELLSWGVKVELVDEFIAVPRTEE